MLNGGAGRIINLAQKPVLPTLCILLSYEQAKNSCHDVKPEILEHFSVATGFVTGPMAGLILVRRGKCYEYKE